MLGESRRCGGRERRKKQNPLWVRYKKTTKRRRLAKGKPLSSWKKGGDVGKEKKLDLTMGRRSALGGIIS